MAKTHPPYPPGFRRQMVELVRAGRGPEELAREFEPSAPAIRNWVEQAERDVGGRDDGLTSAEREELRRLRREVRQLRQEREILAFACTRCGRRCAKLYVPAGARYFLCRHCYGLGYESRREHAHYRAMRRAGKLWARLGDADGDFVPFKPKGMHWRTYRRLVAQAEAAGALADAGFAVHFLERRARLAHPRRSRRRAEPPTRAQPHGPHRARAQPGQHRFS